MSLALGQVLRSDHLNNILRALKEATSVISGLSVEPTSPASMNVIVRAGTAVIGGTVVSLASDTTVAISTPDANYPRFDLVTLKSDGTIGYYAGTPEAAVAVDTTKPETYVKPRPPTTPAGEVALAEVFVPAGATAIDKVIDRRIITGLAAPQLPLTIAVDAEAKRPAAGIKNRIFISSDTLKIFYDTGSAWVLVGELGGLSLPSHSLRHRAGGADQLFDQNLDKSSAPTFAGVNLTGDVVVNKATPRARLSGTETGARIFDVIEDSGKLRVYNATDAVNELVVDPASRVTVRLNLTAGGVALDAHKSRHEKGGADEVKALGSITLDDATLASLTADPSLAKGKLWFRSDLGLLSYSPDGTTVRRVPYGTINVDAHASRHLKGGADEVLNLTNINNAIGFSVDAHKARHEKGGADPISVLGAVTADSISSPLLSPGTDFIVAQPIDADSVNTLRNSPDILLRGKYWTGTASANLDAEIRHVMLSTAPTSKLSFMFGGAEKAYLDNAGNMSIAGSVTVSGNATVKGTLSVGDLEFRNGWRITEDERYGLVLISPSGRKLRLMLEVVE